MSKPLFQLGEIFNEDFRSRFHVAQNNGTISGNPTINGYYEGDGSGDYLTYSKFQWNHIRDFSIFMEMDGLDSFSSQALISSTTTTGPLFRVINSTVIQAFIDQNVSPVQRPHSLTLGESFTFGVSYVDSTDTVEMYLDGISIGGGTFAQGLDRTTQNLMQLFARIGANDAMDGRCKRVRIFNRTLTDEEHAYLDSNSMFTYKNEWAVYAPLQDKIGTSTFTTTDVSGNGINGTYGSGATEPTKLTPQGVFVTGGDRINFGDTGVSSQDYSVIYWAKRTAPASLLVHYPVALGGPSGASGIFFGGTTGSTGPDEIGFIDQANITLSGVVPEVGRKYMVGVSYRSSTNELKIYVDGELKNTGTAIDIDIDDLVVGIRDAGTFSFTGDVYLVGVSRKFLTDTQMKNIYLKRSRYLGNL